MGLILISPILGFNVKADEAATSVVVTFCGNEVKEQGEDCDVLDFGDATCESLGYGGGILACQANCTFDTSDCTAPPEVSKAPTGGFTPPSALVILQGRAYPEAVVTILKDGMMFIAGKKADSSGDFEIRIFDITAGVHTFSFWAEDTEGRRSVTISFTVTVPSAMTTTISGIFIPPTIELKKTSLKKGEILDIIGETAPQSEVSIYIGLPGQETIKKTKAQVDGTWAYHLDTSTLKGDSFYNIKAKATSPDGLVSGFSQVLEFYLEEVVLPVPSVPPIPPVPPVPPVPPALCPYANLNGDNRTDIVDFSILLYWWEKPNPHIDQNGDGWVNLIDFSIMMYYWTG